jgi:hypothetical protein
MKKKMLGTLAIGAALSLPAAPGVLAAEGPVMTVQVPFSFVVGDQQLPSGEYRIAKQPGAGVLRLYSKDQKHQVYTFYVPSSANVEVGGELEFHTHGDQRFLKGIHTADGFSAYILGSRSEREAQAAGPAAPVGMP